MFKQVPLTWFALSGIVAPIPWVVLAVAGEFLYPGYDPLRQTVSELGATGAPLASVLAERGIVTTYGLLTIAFAVGLHYGIGGGSGSMYGPVLLAMFGVFNALQALFFPCDPGCVNTSLAGQMHGWTGTAGFLALLLSMFFLGWRMRKDGEWQRYGRFSLVALTVFVLLFLGFNVIYDLSVLGAQGLGQRIFLGVPILWIEVIGLGLLHFSRTPRSVSTAQRRTSERLAPKLG